MIRRGAYNPNKFRSGKKRKPEETSARVAKIAGKILGYDLQDDDTACYWSGAAHRKAVYIDAVEIRALAASCLNQSPDKSPSKPIRKRRKANGRVSIGKWTQARPLKKRK